MATLLGEGVPHGVVDVCASRIDDPVVRLRFLRSTMAPAAARPKRRGKRWGRPGWPVLGAVLLLAPVSQVAAPEMAGRPGLRATPVEDSAPRVWLAEQSDGGGEMYSNGLRIEGGPGAPGQPRLYKAFARSSPDGNTWRWRAEPAGIVFHRSESDVASFEPEQNNVLKRQGEQLLAYVRRQHCYHFLIDRFGRVHRVVDETAKADHAGHSIWADDEWVYVSLNQSFLGVCFESQTSPGAAISPAQVHSAKVLTEMLRSRYNIPARNCITHAQVSVNPRNFRVGYHTDWAKDFPYGEAGLPDNYLQPLPSLTFFGFDADSTFVEAAGADLRNAVSLAREQMRQAAETRKAPVTRYQAELQNSYHRAAAVAGSLATQ